MQVGLLIAKKKEVKRQFISIFEVRMDLCPKLGSFPFLYKFTANLGQGKKGQTLQLWINNNKEQAKKK